MVLNSGIVGSVFKMDDVSHSLLGLSWALALYLTWDTGTYIFF